MNKCLKNGLVFVSFIAIAGSACAAAGTGWEGVATRLASLANVAILAITALCAAAGVGAIGFAGKMLMKKAGDRGDDVEWSKIGYSLLAGAFLLSVSFIASTSVETLGGDSSNMGKALPTVGGR